jgi:predicted amidohydrolase YtcJ
VNRGADCATVNTLAANRVPSGLNATQVVATVVGGRVVFQR